MPDDSKENRWFWWQAMGLSEWPHSALACGHRTWVKYLNEDWSEWLVFDASTDDAAWSALWSKFGEVSLWSFLDPRKPLPGEWYGSHDEPLYEILVASGNRRYRSEYGGPGWVRNEVRVTDPRLFGLNPLVKEFLRDVGTKLNNREIPKFASPLGGGGDGDSASSLTRPIPTGVQCSAVGGCHCVPDGWIEWMTSRAREHGVPPQ